MLTRFGLLCLVALGAGFALAAEPQIPELNWEERSDWINVVKSGAKADGVADDTDAIQAALNGLGKQRTVYLPPGNYRITKTLTIKNSTGIAMTGHGRTTRLIWDGPKDGVMFWSNGAPYSQYEGIVFDGKGKAAVGIDHAAVQRFETEIDHCHLAFLDFTDAGIRVGNQQKQASAEMIYRNCLFARCKSGVSTMTFNDYDNVIVGCEFLKCEVGVRGGHGSNDYVRDCHFEGSTFADIYAISEHPSSVRRCTSVGSNIFVAFGGPSTICIQDCHVDRWTNKDGAAVAIRGAPCVIFDCVFTNAPDRKWAPIHIDGRDPVKPILSNIVSKSTDELCQPKGVAFPILIPTGKRGGSVTSASQRFLQEQVAIPGKVFDARRDFGAKGDASADDAAAIQATIDAARKHGKGAIAYLPSGKYNVGKTLQITGADYYVGGGGFGTHLVWSGPAGGTILTVNDPQNVTLQHLSVGHGDAGKMNNAVDIQQTSSGGPSTMRYECVYVYGMYANDPFRKGIQFLNLSKDSVVVAEHLQGNTRFTDSSRAKILINVAWEGAMVVEGKEEKQRDGFLGCLTRFNSNEPYGLFVKDNQSVVMTDYYTEGTDGYWSLEGGPQDPAGRVTIVGVKVNSQKFNPINIQDYQGRISGLCLQFYLHETTPYVISHKGTRPLDLLFTAVKGFPDPTLDVKAEKSANLMLVGNQWKGPADVMPAGTPEKVALALDDLRELGQLDLELNFPTAQKIANK